MLEELELFGIFCLLGLGAGCLYDGLRLFRRMIPHNLLWLTVEDILFWSVMGGATYSIFFIKNRGGLRVFGWIGEVIGIFVYAVCISPLFFPKLSQKMRSRERKAKKKRSKKEKLPKPIDE